MITPENIVGAAVFAAVAGIFNPRVGFAGLLVAVVLYATQMVH